MHPLAPHHGCPAASTHSLSPAAPAGSDSGELPPGLVRIYLASGAYKTLQLDQMVTFCADVVDVAAAKFGAELPHGTLGLRVGRRLQPLQPAGGWAHRVEGGR